VSVIASNGAVTPEGNAEAAAAAVVVAADIPGKDLLVARLRSLQIQKWMLLAADVIRDFRRQMT
jgi:hypothetical protein